MNFIEYLTDVLGTTSDAELARRLHITPPAMSKYRHGVTPVGANLILRAHELTDIPIRTLKAAAELECLPIGGRVR